MKRALALTLCGALSACWPFDQQVEDLCAAGRLSDCPVDAGEGQPDGGPNFTFDGGTFSKNGWRWQNPATLPGLGLGVIWGTSDSNVWVAGGSGFVAHFDGATWRPTPYNHPLLPGDGFIESTATDSAGRRYFCGRDMRAIAFDGADASVPADLAQQALCTAVDAWNDTIVFIGAGPADRSYSRYQTAAAAQISLPNGGNVYGYTRVRIDNTNTISVIESGATGYSIAQVGGARAPVFPADGGVVDVISALERDRNGNLRALAFDTQSVSFLASFNDTTQLWESLASLESHRLRAMTPDVLSPDARWLYAGDNGFLGVSGETGVIEQLAAKDDRFGHSWAAWQSPEGTLWAAGEGGQVLRVTRTADGGFNPREVVSQQLQPTIQDLWLRTVPWRAAGDTGVIWTATEGAWVRDEPELPYSIRALVVTPMGEVTFREDESLYLGTTPIGGPLLEPENLNLRLGGLDVLADGGVLLAWGDAVYVSDLSSTTRLDGGLGFTHASDVVVTADGSGWVSAIQAAGAVPVDGGVLKVTGGSLTRVYAGQPVYAVSPAADGGVFALGEHDLLRCDTTCVSLGPNPSARPVSLWVDAKNRVWVLGEDGVVWWGTPQSMQAEPHFWSGGDYAERLPTRIRGNENAVFVVGGHGNIISRPLPP